jgi:hypothetical protein
VFEKFQNRRSFSYEGSYKIENKTKEIQIPRFLKNSNNWQRTSVSG